MLDEQQQQLERTVEAFEMQLELRRDQRSSRDQGRMLPRDRPGGGCFELAQVGSGGGNGIVRALDQVGQGAGDDDSRGAESRHAAHMV